MFLSNAPAYREYCQLIISLSYMVCIVIFHRCGIYHFESHGWDTLRSLAFIWCLFLYVSVSVCDIPREGRGRLFFYVNMYLSVLSLTVSRSDIIFAIFLYITLSLADLQCLFAFGSYDPDIINVSVYVLNKLCLTKFQSEYVQCQKGLINSEFISLTYKQCIYVYYIYIHIHIYWNIIFCNRIWSYL